MAIRVKVFSQTVFQNFTDKQKVSRLPPEAIIKIVKEGTNYLIFWDDRYGDWQ